MDDKGAIEAWVDQLRSARINYPPPEGFKDNSVCILGLLTWVQPTEETAARVAEMRAERLEHLRRYGELTEAATGVLRAVMDRHAPDSLDSDFPSCRSCCDCEWGSVDWPCEEAEFFLNYQG